MSSAVVDDQPQEEVPNLVTKWTPRQSGSRDSSWVSSVRQAVVGGGGHVPVTGKVVPIEPA